MTVRRLADVQPLWSKIVLEQDCINIAYYVVFLLFLL
jgi:hypothetical protein